MLPRSFNWPLRQWGHPWQDELRIMMQRNRLSMLRMKRRFGRPPVASAHLTLDVPASSSPHREFWQPAVAVLHQHLHEPRWHGCRPRIVLANDFSHYAIVPWNATLTDRKERNAFARHCFMQAYGDFSRYWDIRTTPVSYGSPALASAVDANLLQSLEEAFRHAGMHLRHIHPHLMMAVNFIRRRFKRKKLPASFNLVMLDNSQLIVALVEQGQWLSVQDYAAENDIEHQLEALLKREAIIAGIDNSQWPVMLYAANVPEILTLGGRQVYHFPVDPHQDALEAWH